MAPALTGRTGEAPLVPVFLILTLLFPSPSPCLALLSPLPSQPHLLCGKISRYLVVCSPGHHQVQQPGLPLMFSPKSFQLTPDQMGVEGSWSLTSDEDQSLTRLPVIRNPLGKRGQVWVAEEDEPLAKETGGGWLPMQKRDSRETGGGWMPMGKRAGSRET